MRMLAKAFACPVVHDMRTFNLKQGHENPGDTFMQVDQILYRARFSNRII